MDEEMKCGIVKYNRRTHLLWWATLMGGSMRTWITGAWKPALDDPEWSYQIRGIINCWNNRRTALTRSVGKIMGAVRSCIASRFYLSRLKGATGGRWWCSLSSYLSVYGYQDDTEISIRAKTWTNERHDETSERGRNCRYSKSKPDDFLRAKYEHMMLAVLTD